MILRTKWPREKTVVEYQALHWYITTALCDKRWFGHSFAISSWCISFSVSESLWSSSTFCFVLFDSIMLTAWCWSGTFWLSPLLTVPAEPHPNYFLIATKHDPREIGDGWRMAHSLYSSQPSGFSGLQEPQSTGLFSWLCFHRAVSRNTSMASISLDKANVRFHHIKNSTLPTDTISQFLALVLETLLYGIFIALTGRLAQSEHAESRSFHCSIYCCPLCYFPEAIRNKCKTSIDSSRHLDSRNCGQLFDDFLYIHPFWHLLYSIWF